MNQPPPQDRSRLENRSGLGQQEWSLVDELAQEMSNLRHFNSESWVIEEVRDIRLPVKPRLIEDGAEERAR